VVEPFSAILGLPNERAVPVNTDHRGLAHVSPRKPQQYLPIWSSVKELVESCLTPIQADNRTLLEGLFCFDSKSAQMRPRQPQHGTCEWIFRHAKYLSWFHSNAPSMLLLTGSAGSGKSVLARCVAERIQSGGVDRSGSDYVAASYFCSYVEAALNSPEVVLRTLLHQLVQLNPPCGALVRNRLLKRTRTGEEVLDLDIRKMWQTLREVLSMQTMSHVIIVIDAIEELGVTVAKAILGGLWNIADSLRRTQQDNHLRIFVSSRPNLTPSSNGFPGLEILHLGNVDMKADIKLYLSSSIDDLQVQNASFNASITPDLREKVISQISDAAGSMFLAAVLTWEDFKRGLLWNQDVVVQKLKRVVSSGSSMTSFYDRLMDKIDPFMLDDALSIFSILSAAARPLSEAEIGTILGICRSSRHITRSSDFEPFSNLSTIMEDSFQDLIIVGNDNTVTFIHLSFKDYLISQEKFKRVVQKGRQNITKACLVYLKLRDLLQSAVEKTEYDELATRYPFLSYATSHFYWHIKQLSTDDPLWLLFADTAGKYSIYTLASMWPVHRYFHGSPLQHILFHSFIPDFSALELARRFHEHGYDVDEKWRGSFSGATLRDFCLYSSHQPYKEAALLLLEFGANPNLPESSGRTNIGLALENRAWDLYDTLLSHTMTDLSARNVRGETLLHHQMQFGTLDRITELLDLIDEVDLNPQDCEGRTPLHVATMLEKEDAVRMLLAKPGIRLNLVDNMGRTPLALATYWGRNKMALTLIEHAGAFPLAEEGHLSALVLAAKRGDKDICTKLLVTCHYQNLQFHHDMSGKGILHHAAINDWSDLIETCLLRGGRTIDIDQIDHSGRSALHYASSLGNVASCKALINGGASLTLQDRLGRTAAQAAADAGFKDAVLLLLKSGRVDPTQKDSERRSLVHWAATIDCVDVMELISQMPGVKLDQKDCHGKTPIDIAYICQCKYVGLFLASKVPHLNIYSWDLIYRAPLLSSESIYRQEEFYTTYENDLLIRNAQRQQAAHEEHRELQKQYPPELWALTSLHIA
ncbi:hypothetical protein ACHAPQ_011844, partial [Fusarium lateritium]